MGHFLLVILCVLISGAALAAIIAGCYIAWRWAHNFADKKKWSE